LPNQQDIEDLGMDSANQMNLSALLQRSEGDTLDFKRNNYQFRNATEDEKSELLKDILALANAWKATHPPWQQHRAGISR
jgi:hypothetical protein